MGDNNLQEDETFFTLASVDRHIYSHLFWSTCPNYYALFGGAKFRKAIRKIYVSYGGLRSRRDLRRASDRLSG
jgi:hypothetical protein